MSTPVTNFSPVSPYTYGACGTHDRDNGRAGGAGVRIFLHLIKGPRLQRTQTALFFTQFRRSGGHRILRWESRASGEFPGISTRVGSLSHYPRRLMVRRCRFFDFHNNQIVIIRWALPSAAVTPAKSAPSLGGKIAVSLSSPRQAAHNRWLRGRCRSCCSLFAPFCPGGFA